MTFKLVINKEMPREISFFERLIVPNKITNKQDEMIYDKRDGKIAYFPRLGSFEVYLY
jgi:hypothetical protein